MLRRLRGLVPSRGQVSSVVEVAGLSCVGFGAWSLWGQSVGLIVAGVLATLYGVALGQESE